MDLKPCRGSKRAVRVGGATIGGGASVSIQGMTKCDTKDTTSALAQIRAMRTAGCDIVRVAIPDSESAHSLAAIIASSPIPVVADVHFDYRLAIASLAAGAHKIRINPGNIGGKDKVRIIAREAAARGVPIRIGVNAGSLEKDILRHHGHSSARGMVESARRQVGVLEDAGFHEIVISLKSSSVPVMLEAYRLAASEFPYPLHVGVTETGSGVPGIVKSSMGIGSLLCDGIGDTIRVSLTGDPVQEILVGAEILVAAGLRKGRPEIISCPTCGRCSADIEQIVVEVRRRLEPFSPEIKVAVMGCEVNGPGEAREADVGVAMGEARGVIFGGGKVLKTVPRADVVDELVNAVIERSRTIAGEDRR